jgi:hypothetical protein
MESGTELAGRYRLDRLLKSGGMGEVWRGYDRTLRRPVAIKLMLGLNPDEAALARFRREWAVAARIQHPGITVVHDAGDHEGALFIVMELLHGEDLGVLLDREGRLPVERAVNFGIQLADALAEAHRHGVVHRDLKPSNLFILPGPRLKICDFGIARHVNGTAVTQPGELLGTAPYMSPEQWASARAAVSMDLYAVGCILYEMLVGQPPFRGDLPSLLRQHVQEVPIPPRSVNGEIPVGLNDLVVALLAKEPGNRPLDADTVLSSLRRFQDDLQREAVTGTRARPAWQLAVTPPWHGDAGPGNAIFPAPIGIVTVDAAGHIRRYSRPRDGRPPGWADLGAPPGKEVTALASCLPTSFSSGVLAVAGGILYGETTDTSQRADRGWSPLPGQRDPTVGRPMYIDVAVWPWMPELDGMGILALDDGGHIFQGSVPLPLARDRNDTKTTPWKSVAPPDAARTTAIDIEGYQKLSNTGFCGSLSNCY